jgi:hypothetical protein
LQEEAMAVDLFKDAFDINKNYFYMPFGPTSISMQKCRLEYVQDGDYYFQQNTNTKWRRVYLYDTGWGRPDGFERLPELPFDSLLQLVLLSDYKSFHIWHLSIWELESNQYGAASIIMDRHIDDLLDFLNNNIDNEDFTNNVLYKKNLRLFSDLFDHFNQLSYQYPRWQRIAQRVRSMIS